MLLRIIIVTVTAIPSGIIITDQQVTFDLKTINKLHNNYIINQYIVIYFINTTCNKSILKM